MKRFLSFVMCIALLVTMTAVGAPYGKTLEVEAAGTKLVAITFDDGPSFRTPGLLDELRAMDAKVTFFVNGSNGPYAGAANRPSDLDRMAADGHQIANHTFSHSVPFDGLSASTVRSEVEGVNTYIYNAVGGKYQTLVRTPGGANSSTIRANVDAPIILWSVDTMDWKLQDATAVCNNILNNVGDGSVVLLHDLYAPSIEGALRAMRTLKTRGYEFVTVSELFRRRGIALQNGVVYTGAFGTGVDLPAYRAPSIAEDIGMTAGCARVTLTAQDSGLTLYYTTDGTTPTLSSKRYTGPMDIPCDTTLKVIGIDKFGTRTPVASKRIEKQYDGVFDASYYLSRYPELRQQYGTDEKALLDHFLKTGLYEGRQASPLFAIDYYMTQYRDLSSIYGANRTAYMAHFQSNGMKEGRRGSVQFDPVSYRLQYADLRRAFKNDWKKYYMHYLRAGMKENRAGTGCRYMENALTVYEGRDYASVYNYAYYTTKYPDILKAFGYDDEATLRHFVKAGMREKRQGNAQFDVRSYYRQYPDLRRVYGQSFEKYYLHYIANGKREGRASRGCAAMVSPTTVYAGVDYAAVYDYTYYLEHQPQVLAECGEDDTAVLRHFATVGMPKGVQGNEAFSVESYYKQYPDLRRAFGTDLTRYYYHYIKVGKREGRRTSGCTAMVGYTTVQNGVDYAAVYDYNTYMRLHPDLAKVYKWNEKAALAHFVRFGVREGRQASDAFSVKTYRARYADLQRAFGDAYEKYVNHYLKCGIREGRRGI